MKIIRPLSLVAAVGFALSAALANASALSSQGTLPTAIVNYADLDVGTETGAKTLYARIVEAAQSVCPTFDHNNLSAMSRHELCVRAAINSAVNSVSSPMLAATAATHTKHV